MKELPEEGGRFYKFLIFMKEYVRLAECSLFAETGEHTAMMGEQ